MCSPRPIASAGSFRLDSCPECGHFSVHLGPITVRLDATALGELRRLLERADVEPEDRPTNPLPAPRGFVN